VVAFLSLLALCAARPLDWGAEERVNDPHANIPGDMAVMVEREGGMTPAEAHGATSFVQMTTAGHPLECDCERVKCNCVKRCECGLPPANQNRQATAFLELIGGAVGEEPTPLLVDMDTNECFLETGEKVGQDAHHMLDCECDKVKCNCVKHCECSLPSAGGAGAGANNMLLQSGEGATNAAKTADNSLLQVSEGTTLKQADADAAEDHDLNPAMGAPAGADSDEEEKVSDLDQSTEEFMKASGMSEGPPKAKVSKKRSRAVAQSDKSGKGKDDEYSYSYSYAGEMSDTADEKEQDAKKEYSYSYE
jgi:hypothetical protein